MSFKNFSASQAAPSNDKPDDKTKVAPAVGEPAAQPAKKQDEAAPAQEPSKGTPKPREAETDRRAVDRAEDEGMIVHTR